MSLVFMRGGNVVWELTDDQENCLMCLGRHCFVFGEMPTFEEVADHLEQTVEHTIRVFSELRAKRLIEWDDEKPRSFRMPIPAIEVMAAVIHPDSLEPFDDDECRPAALYGESASHDHPNRRWLPHVIW